MGVFNKLARNLRRTASKAADLDAAVSLDPAKIGRRIANKAIGRALHHVMERFFLKGSRKKNV